MNPFVIIKIIALIWELIANGSSRESAIDIAASRFGISASDIDEFLA